MNELSLLYKSRISQISVIGGLCFVALHKLINCMPETAGSWKHHLRHTTFGPMYGHDGQKCTRKSDGSSTRVFWCIICGKPDEEVNEEIEHRILAVNNPRALFYSMWGRKDHQAWLDWINSPIGKIAWKSTNDSEALRKMTEKSGNGAQGWCKKDSVC